MSSSAVATRARTTSAPLRHPELLTGRSRAKRAVLLLLMTLVLPGAAQVTAGNRRLGRVGLRIWVTVLAGLAVTAFVALLDRRLALSMATSSWVLLTVVLLLVFGALAWPLFFADAWRLGIASLQSVRARRVVSVLAAGLVLMTSLPLAYAARQVSVGRGVLAGIFGGASTDAGKDGRYNVLLLGGDAGKNRVGTRPDSITLVSVDARTGRSVLFSFPRNLENIPFPADSPMHRALPNGFDCGDDCLLNAVYSYASEHKGIYPSSVKDPGAQATKDAVSAITGLPVDYYVLIDLQGFQKLVDAMGGLTLDVQRRVPIGGGTSPVTGYIPVGRQRLDGFRALWFARSREGSSDYERMARQRCTMTAMLQQMNPRTVLLKFEKLATASKAVVSTDIAQDDLGRLTDLALRARSHQVKSVQFVPPLIKPVRPDYALIQRSVASALRAKTKAAPARSAGAPSAAGASSAAGTPAGRTSPKASTEAVDAGAVCRAG